MLIKLYKVEIRLYNKMIITKVDGFGDSGFSLLFRYITRDNNKRASIEMTPRVHAHKITLQRKTEE